MSEKRIAIVNQRYGLEVNGGSEYYTRKIAHMLKKDYEVEVLTTTALDYNTWDNYYNTGIQELEGVTVRRFSVDCNRKLMECRILNRLMRVIHSEFLGRRWIDAQGPMSKDLIMYIEEHKEDYDAFMFVTYLYYHTAVGLPKVAEKAILIPTAHNEPYIHFGIYRQIFTSPKAIVYLTEEERAFVQKKFHNEAISNDVIGIGIDLPQKINPEEFRQKCHIQGQYIIYVGRVDADKGCGTLFHYFIRYTKIHHSNLKLILVGKVMMELPKHSNIISVGFISEEDKFDAIAGSQALILPSEYESLSISVLEAMALSKPVIVNGNCAVLRAHCIKSKGGLYFTNYEEFEACLKIMLQTDSREYQDLKQNAHVYIKENYTWDACREKFKKILDKF